MNQPAEFEFSVDEQYENEKGVFRVIAIQGDEMIIRWENGEEIRTEIDLQLRIAERRQREKQEREFADNPSKSATAGEKPVFSGFAPTDFKKSASGTIWRSRSQLGAAVAQKIDTARFKFNSWAFGNKPEMHVQDIEHHGLTENEYQARFFIKVDYRALYYGFRVARPDNKGDVAADWKAFSDWLIHQENERMLHEIALKEKLTVSNLVSPSSGTLLASDDGWCADKAGCQSCEALTGYINDTPETRPFDLQLSGIIDKNEAVACGLDIVENIARLFTRLLPLYQAAVIH